jgi:hypothetical protein
MSWLRPLGFAGLLVAAVLVAILATRGAGPKSKGAAAPASARVPVLGEPPPEDVDRSPAAAQRYVEQQNCLAECETVGNLCGAAQEDAKDCGAAKRACAQKCR